MPQRSHANVELGQQVYALLEQCRKPEVLWAELATGHYDWLGVRRNGKYVLGRPRLSTIVPEDAGPPPDDAVARHRVESLRPLQRVPRWEAHPTPEEAREVFRRFVAGDPVTPLRASGVWRVRLVLDGRPVEERYVVRPLPRVV
ncbi:hypothetical protein ACI8AC_13155 [Geodermatophilus sp. SYSU D00758]